MNGKIGKGVAELYTLFEEYEQGQLKKYSWEINSRLCSCDLQLVTFRTKEKGSCVIFYRPKKITYLFFWKSVWFTMTTLTSYICAIKANPTNPFPILEL